MGEGYFEPPDSVRGEAPDPTEPGSVGGGEPLYDYHYDPLWWRRLALDPDFPDPYCDSGSGDREDRVAEDEGKACDSGSGDLEDQGEDELILTP